jgi:hypothetical protein
VCDDSTLASPTTYHAQKALTCVYKYGRLWKMKCNAPKSTAVVFSKVPLKTEQLNKIKLMLGEYHRNL